MWSGMPTERRRASFGMAPSGPPQDDKCYQRHQKSRHPEETAQRSSRRTQRPPCPLHKTPLPLHPSPLPQWSRGRICSLSFANRSLAPSQARCGEVLLRGHPVGDRLLRVFVAQFIEVEPAALDDFTLPWRRRPRSRGTAGPSRRAVSDAARHWRRGETRPHGSCNARGCRSATSCNGRRSGV